MAYFQTKDGSLEESIRKAVSGIQEKVEYVEYKFKNRNDAMKAKKMLDAIQLMGFEINDDNISNGEISVDAGNRDMTKYHKDIMKKFRPKVITQEKLVGGQKELDKDKDGDIDAKDFAILRKDAKKESYELEEKVDMQTKSYITDIVSAINRNPKLKYMKPFAKKFKDLAMKTGDVKKSLEAAMPDYVAGADIMRLLNMGDVNELTKAQEKLPPALQKAIKAKEKKESYELGTPENTKSKLDATPGQSADDWQQQVDTMQKKNASMREALAKVWGMEEGRNPFADNPLPKKEEKKEKKETKTMTGKPMTKVNIDPDMKETKIGKKNVR